MFTKVRPKQEQFLWLVVDGMPATRAYASVYGSHLSEMSCAVSASKMLKTPKVMARRQELLAAKMQKQPITLDFLTRELLAVSGEARALGQAAAASGALLGIAKLHGLLVDKVQMDALVRKPTESPEAPAEMSEEDWLTKYGVISLIAEPIQPVVNTPEEETIPTDQGSESPDPAQYSDSIDG